MTYEGYVEQMRHVVNSASRRLSRHHPLLASEDIRQEAMLALWKIWSRYQHKSPDELGRLGTTAIKRSLRDVLRDALTQKRYSPNTSSLDADTALSRELGAPSEQEAKLERTYLNYGLAEIDRMLAEMPLSCQDTSVFWEMLDPSVSTIKELQARWRERAQSMNPKEEVRSQLGAVAQTLKRPEKEVRRSWAKICKTVKTRETP